LLHSLQQFYDLLCLLALSDKVGTDCPQETQHMSDALNVILTDAIFSVSDAPYTDLPLEPFQQMSSLPFLVETHSCFNLVAIAITLTRLQLH
jgi:hypothetical protein